jgi:hypothetical protein
MVSATTISSYVASGLLMIYTELIHSAFPYVPSAGPIPLESA